MSSFSVPWRVPPAFRSKSIMRGAVPIVMAAWALAAGIASVAHGASDDPMRLDSRIRPVTQSIHLWLNPASNTYTGFTRVELAFAVPTNRFRFHALAMDLGATTLNGGRLALTVSTNPAGWVTAQSERTIPAGVHAFESWFTNNFNRNGAGIYKTVSEGRPYLFTQFEPMDARQAFPCWDEPEFKIPWRVAVTAPEGIEVVGNMPVAGVMSRDGTTTHEFGRTPPMPSYLVAMAAGPFESVDIPGQSVPGRIVTPKGQVHLAEMARGNAPSLLGALERYFGIPHPYPKLDHIAVPAFASGAMENVGAITYREAFLLLDQKHAAIDQRQLLVLIVAHEMAHQWFGNLVTMKWWDDLWLNEAFASWAAFKVGRQLHPDLRFELMDREFGAAARAVDSQPSVKAIRRSLAASANVREALDSLTYNKGMAILNMAESWIGEDVFRSALQVYFRRHAWGNARGEDLWQVFAESGDASVPETLRRYIEQPGIPEVSFKRLPGNRLEVSQRRYRTLVAGEPTHTLWQVPIVLKFGIGSETRTERRLLTRQEQTFDVPGLDGADWLHPNAGEAGYYLWSLSPDLNAALRDRGWPRLGVLEQLGMLQSADFAVSSGQASPLDALRLALAARGDSRPEIRTAVVETVVRWREILPPAERGAYAPFVRAVLRPMLDAIGMEPRDTDVPAAEALRQALISHLGILGEDPEVIAFSRAMAHRQLQDPQSVPASIATATLSVATWHGDRAWAALLRRAHESATQPDVRMRLQARVAAFRDPELAQEGMDYALTDAVPPTNVYIVLEGRPELAGTRMTWLEKNYSALKAKITAEGLDELPSLMSGADPEVMGRARRFFLDGSRRTPLTELRLREVEDAGRLDQALRERHVSAVRAYLEKADF